MEKQLAFPSLSCLKIKIQEAKIIINSAAFHAPAMQTGWRIKNLAGMKITAAADISVQDLLPALLLQVQLQKKLMPSITINAAVTSIAGETDLEKGLQKGIDAKDSVGGIIECKADGLPAGLGEPYFDSVESVLSHILFAIPAVRGVEFGTGFAAAGMFGSQHNDAIENMEGATRSNHAGGIVGGISNGNELIFRLAVKPTSSTPKEQNSLNWDTGNTENFSIKGRHDLCVALRAPVIVEAVTALVLADFMLQQQHIKRVIV